MKKNILANFIGTGWVAILTFASVPFYVRYLGLEAYGLIGFFITLQTLFLMLDFGLSAALTRELAYLSGLTNKETEMRNLLRSTEILYWSVSLILAIAVVSFSGVISRSWLRLDSISPDTARRTISLMGLVLFFRWPVILYMGGVLGLQRQVLANGIKIVMETIRVGGVLLVLSKYSATIEVFFGWQVLVTAAYSLTLMAVLWGLMPQSKSRTSFSFLSLHSIWRFAAGMAGISVTAALLSQMDKIVLSKYLVLNEFGYYSLASSLAMGLAQISTPISIAAYPRFTQLVAQNEMERLKENYHKVCQWISVFAIPIALVIYFYSEEVLFVWTNDRGLALNARGILKVLVAGTCCNVLVTLPYTLQLAYKWTRLAFITNMIAACVLFPLLMVAVHKWGSIGAAWMWLLLNASYLLINIQLMHRKLLSHEKMNWYSQDLLKPFLGALLVVMVFYFLPNPTLSRIGQFYFLGLLTGLSMLGAGLNTYFVRSWLFSFFRIKGS